MNKLYIWILKHPIIATVIMYFVVYPLYVLVAYVWAATLPILHNIMTDDHWTLATGILPQLCIFGLIPWIIKLCMTIPAVRNPYGKYGTFYAKRLTFIDVATLMALPTFIECIYIYSEGTFMVSNYLAMAIIIAIGHTIGLIYKLCKLHKLNRRLKQVDW